MATPQIKTFKKIIPMIYAYTTPDVISHQGWTKIGYTAKQTVKDRIKQQTHTADVEPKLLWTGNARYQDGSGETFTDHEFHNYLSKRNVERKSGTEWFHIDGDTSHQYFYKFADRDNSDLQKGQGSDYKLRQEQQAAVDKTIKYFINNGEGSEFLWNAKPRFGKTLTTYDLIRQMKFTNILVVTNRPSIANSWFDDFDKFIAAKTNLKFVSETDALKERPVLSRKDFLDSISDGKEYGQVAFESLQGLKGSVYFGGNYDKLKWIKDLNWDLLVIDEAHEGVDTYKTDKAFDKINRKYTLHLTGTPFKALAQGKFSEEQIYNWSYADEQQAKEHWYEIHESQNPYEVMPKLNMYTYQISEMMTDKLKQGLKVDQESIDPAFDLNEFFKTKNGKFIYEDAVDHFLDALTKQEKYPFSTPELRQELAHTFWLLNRVDSAKALAKKLKEHPVFKDYKIILAAGNGKLDDDQLDDTQFEKASEKSFDRVKRATEKFEKTITLSVGQLTTGVTIKPWSGVLMLSNMKSPSEYMQAAFRAQNPYTFNRNDDLVQKENAYVFDFDPTRTLIIFDEFANNLQTTTVNGKGTVEDRKEKIRKLLNFFPVIGEDEEGKMVELDAEAVMSIPRRLKSKEVVDKKFMSNFLFANISRIFGAPKEVREILNGIVKAKEEKKMPDKDAIAGAEDAEVDENGEVTISNERVIGKAKELFGDKIYEDLGDKLSSKINQTEMSDFGKAASAISKELDDSINTEIVNRVSQEYGIKKDEANRYKKKLAQENKNSLAKIADEANDRMKVAEATLNNSKNNAQDEADLEKAQLDYQKKINEIKKDFERNLQDHVEKTASEVPEKVIRRIEESKEKKKVQDIQEDARAHLRGFSRTIPSFIMAYGDEQLTLQNFDEYTEDDVFKEVTGITEEQFRFLRDGGDYIDEETGEKKHFEGHLFDEVVFNDSIKQFLDLKRKLSNYFDESNKEDIFDYIPPQKTNQIYTPKAVVKHMVDDLEANNPGIFDDPDKTFADLYMKSGLYITEIVKRLYNNKKMKKLFPDNQERIMHIIQHQVYGLAPTRIIYLIATNYIFGFDESLKRDVLEKHFKQMDAAELAKNGTLEERIKQEFGQGE
ncbi:DEAD/DEAH box helicase family protein [Lactobacillus rodentium]|nr:DEAD/DEAH box helicase family protein [Lactobacillus rodentium]MCR1894486.1 DEAD/DEAH box helicase family protein [Lactobacillus rodentium]